VLRRAVIQHMKTSVPSLGGQVYQAFLAPANITPPYSTVKVAGTRGSPAISYAGFQPVEVRIYDPQESFVSLDALEQEVINVLHGVEVEDQIDGEKYYLQWTGNGPDYVDEDRNLICRLIYFGAAVIYEPGGG